jgi:xanthine/uracil permease
VTFAEHVGAAAQDLIFWFRRVPFVVKFTLLVCVAVSIGAVVALVTVANRTDIDPRDIAAEEQLSMFAAQLSVDFESAVTALPVDVIKKLESSTDNGVVGKIAKRTPSGRCLGFQIEVPYVLEDRSLARAVVGDVVDQDPEVCR